MSQACSWILPPLAGQDPVVIHKYPDELSKVFSADVVVRLDEDLSELALPDGVVLGVELVEAVECVAILQSTAKWKTKFQTQLPPPLSKHTDTLSHIQTTRLFTWAHMPMHIHVHVQYLHTVCSTNCDNLTHCMHVQIVHVEIVRPQVELLKYLQYSTCVRVVRVYV